MGISDHLNCLLRNLYAGQEVTVRERERESYVCVCVCVCVYTYTSLHIATCLFNLQAEYIIAGIRVAWRNTNNLRCADDTTSMAESKEEIKSLLLRVKEECEKDGLKLNIQKTMIMASSPIPSWQIEWEKVETVKDFIFLVFIFTVDGD